MFVILFERLEYFFSKKDKSVSMGTKNTNLNIFWQLIVDGSGIGSISWLSSLSDRHKINQRQTHIYWYLFTKYKIKWNRTFYVLNPKKTNVNVFSMLTIRIYKCTQRNHDFTDVKLEESTRGRDILLLWFYTDFEIITELPLVGTEILEMSFLCVELQCS